VLVLRDELNNHNIYLLRVISLTHLFHIYHSLITHQRIYGNDIQYHQIARECRIFSSHLDVALYLLQSSLVLSVLHPLLHPLHDSLNLDITLSLLA